MNKESIFKILNERKRDYLNLIKDTEAILETKCSLHIKKSARIVIEYNSIRLNELERIVALIQAQDND